MDITQLLAFGVEQSASDCHLSSGEPPMLRIHGELKKLDIPALTREEVHALVYDIMSDVQRKVFEETHECDFSFELGTMGRFRVNVFLQRKGEGAVFRTIPTKLLTLEELGMPPVLKQLCSKEKGLILVTGPTGSGKSTTLAAMIDYLNNDFEGHILTIEDPIEFVHTSKKCLVNQRELGPHTYSFANALRAALREDPDIILLGEMRDLEKKGGGRVAALEIMVGTTAVRNLIREGKVHQLPGTIQVSQKDGMQTMDMALQNLVGRGVITREEAQTKSMNPSLFGSTTLGTAGAAKS